MENLNKETQTQPYTIFGVRVSFIRLGKDYFNTKWLLSYGFWRIVWFGIVAKFGYTTVNKEPINGVYVSYGTSTPLQELWDKGYKVCLVGEIFNEAILEYRLN